jgi:hypothetical protein
MRRRPIFSGAVDPASLLLGRCEKLHRKRRHHMAIERHFVLRGRSRRIASVVQANTYLFLVETAIERTAQSRNRLLNRVGASSV